MKKLYKLKSIVLLIGLFMCTTGVKAQEYTYTPFPTEKAVWSVNTIKYGVSGDTIIKEKQYSKVWKQDLPVPFEFDFDEAEYFCAIRNDIGNKRVYGIYRDKLPVYDDIGQLVVDTADNNEFLLYDFSLKVGDEIQVATFDGADEVGYIQMSYYKRVEQISLQTSFENYI